MQLDDVNIGGQLKVGTGECPPIKEGTERINGSALVEGPMVVGSPTAFAGTDATLMAGPLTNSDPDCEMPMISMGVSGKQPLAFKTKGNVWIEGDLHVTGSTDTWSDGRLLLQFLIAYATPKKFDIQHPIKGEGHRLVHACIEGPEAGVYFRGRCRNKNVIEMPYYWKGLVHEDSISVQLQPIGAHQDIIVKRWDDEKIYLQANGGMPIDCFYHVYGERKDTNPLTVEYEGKSYQDYPDPDGNDPKYSANRCTFTR